MALDGERSPSTVTQQVAELATVELSMLSGSSTHSKLMLTHSNPVGAGTGIGAHNSVTVPSVRWCNCEA